MVAKRKKLFSAYVKKRRKLLEKQARRLNFRVRLKLFAKRKHIRNRVASRFQQKRGAYFTFAYAFVALAIAVGILPYTLGASEQLVSGFIFGSAGVIGGTLAIIFTFHTLLVTFALDQYPPEFFKLSGYERRLDVLYLILGSLTLTQFLLGLVYDGSQLWSRVVITQLVILIIFTAIYCLFRALALVRSRLDPLEGIARINNRAIQTLNNSKKFADAYVEVLLKNPDLNKQQRQLVYYQPYFELHRSYEDLNRFLGYLHNYHDKLARNRDMTAAKMVLDSIGAIICRYIEINQKSLMPMMQPDNPLTPTTIAEQFFNTNYEKLLEHAKYYIDERNIDGVRKISEVWQKIARHTVTIEYNNLLYENPEFERCLLYFGMAADHAIKANYMEAVFEFSKPYATFGELAIKNDHRKEMGAIYKKLTALQLWGATHNEDVVQYQASWALAHIAAKLVDRADFDKLEMDSLVDAVSQATNIYLLSVSDSVATQALDQLEKPIAYIANALLQKVSAASNFNNPQRFDEQRRILQLLDHLYDLVRKVCDKQPIADRLIAMRYARIIEILFHHLLPCVDKRPWQQHADGLKKELISFAHLYGWFAHNMKQAHASYFDSSVESVAKLGLSAAAAGHYEITDAAISSIKHIAMGMLDAKGSMRSISTWDASREAAKIGLVALYAFHNGNMATVKHAQKELADFNQKYFKVNYPNGLGDLPHEVQGIRPYPYHVYAEVKELFNNVNPTHIYPSSIHDKLLNRLTSLNISDKEIFALRKYLKPTQPRLKRLAGASSK